jgi:hypothetical protein
MKYIVSVLKRYRWKIALIYFYIIISQSLFLLEPYFLGKTIDGLLKREYTFLWLLLISHFGENLFMYKRMVFDIKVYTQIYNDLVKEYLERDLSSNTSIKIARTEMLHTVINFLEHHLHFYISAIMSIIGSLYFVFIQHSMTGIVMVSCFPFITLIVFFYYKKIAQAMKVGNTHYEEKFRIMDSGIVSLIDTFYKRRKRIVVFQSIVSARHWFSLNITKILFLMIALVIFTSDNTELTHGAAISIYTYINQFLHSLMSLPIFVEIYTRIKDVVKRISGDENL